MSEWGGTANATITDTNAYKYDAAVNIPIVKDVLALRLAGLSDENEWTRVETIKRSGDPRHNVNPSRETEALRASARFEPVDWFSLDLMYQTLDQENASYAQVQSTSLLTGAPSNGALIRPYDLLSTDDQGGRGRQDMDIYIWNADVRLAGQKISYSGSYNVQDFGSMGVSDAGDYFAAPRFTSTERAFRDPANAETVCQTEGRKTDLVPTNLEFYQCNHARATRRSHELRLASEERIAGIFDYTVGALYDYNSTPVRLTQETPLLVSPTTIGAINLTAIVRDGESTENSVFGNVTAHLGESFELSGGLRYIDYEATSSITVGGVTPTPDIDDPATATVYTTSAKYQFNDDLMVYATVGSSWRPGVHVIGNFSVNLTPRELGFINLEPEESTSYETGFKASFLDRRVRFNLSVYRQDFDNYVYRGNQVYFVNYSRVTPTIVIPEVGAFNFVAGVPAQVDGVEAEASWQISRRWSVGGNISYADGEIDNAVVACTDLNGDGVSDVNAPRPTLAQLQAAVGAGQNVAQCQFSGPAAFTPEWSANLQTETDFAVTDKMDGFVRAIANYSPSNSQDPSNTFDDVDSYAMLNLFAGVRDPDGRWEVSLFAKNVFDEQVVLNSGSSGRSTNLTTLTFGPGGVPTGSVSSQFTAPYNTVEILAPREVGVSVRMGFGSR
jgi:iron complex outermembrane receptor protein